MNTFDAAHVQGQLQTIDAAKAMTGALFHSVEYANRNRNDADFVADLYTTFLLRAPDPSGYAFWLGVLRNDNSNGLDGRAHLIQAFVESPEFRTLIIGLTDTPASGPVCNPADDSHATVKVEFGILALASARLIKIRQILAWLNRGCAICIR